MQALPEIKKNFSEWYQEVIYQAELADQTPVRGSMVIRPYGYAIWEHIREILNQKIKETGHDNVAFPLFIPESFIKRESAHVEGFAPELAIVTYAGGKKLEEPLVVRPTSETMVHYMFARWIKSWRDLPLKINQWANVVRWELRPRPFLRTTEFFWQEGHTAHESYEEAEQEVETMLGEYVDLVQNYLAIPVVTGQKSAQEKFPGAEKTLTLEALMPDGKALQMGTSHLLSQSFAQAFDMKYQNREEKLAYPYLTSWGTTTRLVGAVIMTHGDQKGLILPPAIAPIQVVIIPIFKKGQDKQLIVTAAQKISENLQKEDVRAHIDSDETRTPGAKFYKWELKGVPLRVEIGPRDIENNQAIIVDRLSGDKKTVILTSLAIEIAHMLTIIQRKLFENAQARMQEKWFKGEKLAEFGPIIDQKPGFYQTGWCGNSECELALKEYKASIRCLREEKTLIHCFNCNKENIQDVLVAKAY